MKQPQRQYDRIDQNNRVMWLRYIKQAVLRLSSDYGRRIKSCNWNTIRRSIRHKTKRIPKAKEPLHESPVKTAEYYIYEHQKAYSYSK